MTIIAHYLRCHDTQYNDTTHKDLTSGLSKHDTQHSTMLKIAFLLF
jgi:hypothetical protein